MKSISVVIPAKNESAAIANVVKNIISQLSDAEVIVVDDGSTDNTAALAKSAGAKVISHPYSKGNGAAIKTGARNAGGELIVFMDGDGQHDAKDIERLLAKMDEGHDMVVGARQGLKSQASLARGGANIVYNRLASWMVGRKVEDLTSGFRVVDATKFREFINLLPNGFSYPTTSTMAFFRAGYSVAYIPILAGEREGSSHINVFKDGLRFLLIIFKVGTLYSPLKLFFPVSASFFLLGFSNYLYTYLSDGRFTNMSMLMMVTSVLVFLIGLVSEQITALLFMSHKED